MRAILIPVKEFAVAKNRLSPVFTPAARAGLANALCADFFEVVRKVKGVDAVFVVSKERVALERAERLRWQTIVESAQISESHSVDHAAQTCAAQGVTGLLRLPVDLPLVEPSDIEEVLAALDGTPGAVIVPSADGTGTNALLRSPPSLFPSHFGPGSFAKHCAAAQTAGVTPLVLHNRRVAHDIDYPADFVALEGRIRQDSALAAWLKANPLAGAGS